MAGTILIDPKFEWSARKKEPRGENPIWRIMRRSKACPPARETIVFHHLLFRRATTRDSRVNEGGPRRGERGRNQISSISSFPLRSPRFFIPPPLPRLYPRIFPSTIAI